MRPPLPVLIALLAACAGGPVPAPGPASAPRPRVILISVDGLWARDLQRAESVGVRLPVLDSLRRAGALAAGVIGSYPSVTYPSHTTIVTGVPPLRHGIYSNRPFTPPTEPMDDDPWYWEAVSVLTPTLFDVAHQAGLTTAALGWPVTADDPAITYNLPEIWHPRVFGDSDLAVMRARGTPGILDSLGAAATGHFSDSLRAEWTAAIVRRWNPDFVALHLIGVDGAKHARGVWHDSVVVALHKTDREIARVVAAVRATDAGRRTTIVITSDHGFLDYSQTFRAGVLLAQAGLVTLDSGGRVTAWDAAVLTNGGSVMILPRDSSDRSLAGRIRAAIPDSLVGPGRPIRAVWPRDTVVALGGDPRAVWTLELNEGFYSSWGYRGALLTPRRGGGHGYDPRVEALHCFFLASGPGVRGGTTLRVIRQTDIAPTIAALLGLRLPVAEGQRVLP